METKEFRVTVPDGYEIDKKDSTFECIKFKPKGLTYEKIAKSLFWDREFYYTNHFGLIYDTNCRTKDIIHPNNGTSKKQLEKLIAINKLMNVAKYLNCGWKPDWTNSEEFKYSIFVTSRKAILTDENTTYARNIVYFKRIELARQAINILGKDTIYLAYSTDW